MNGVFVDMGNLYYCVNRRFSERRLDYQKFYDKIAELGDIQRALAYGGEIANEAEGFKMCLRRIGFDPKYRRLRTSDTNPKQVTRRVDWSVGIAVDVFRMMAKIDEVILCTANNDIIPLVNYLKESNIKVTIFACGIPYELKTSADRCFEITEAVLENRKMEEEFEPLRESRSDPTKIA